MTYTRIDLKYDFFITVVIADDALYLITLHNPLGQQIEKPIRARNKYQNTRAIGILKAKCLTWYPEQVEDSWR